MDKQTGSNTSSQSTSESPRDISLGCGPSPASSSAASSPSTATGGNSSASASAGNSKFAPLTTSATMSPQKIAPSGNIPLPLGAPISGAVVGATQSHQPQQQQQTSLPPPITLNINTTTGGNFSVIVDASNTVENLKKVIARKLKVAKDRICLLHREKELHEGTLKDNGLLDGSKIILIPNVETGLLAQRPENTVMQALESLNDSQVNDFLSGKTPLNLSMRLGDHMMLIQLQLSTVNPVNTAAHSGSSSRTRSSQRSSRSSSSSAAASSGHNHHSHHHHHHHHHHTSSATNSSATTAPVASTSAAARKIDVDTATAGGNNNVNIQGQSQPATTENGTSAIPNLRIPSSPANAIKSSDLSSFLSKRDYESLQNIVRSIAMAQPANLTQSSKVNSFPVQSERKASTSTLSMDSTCCGSNLTSKQGLSTVNAVPSSAFHSSDAALLEQSPIKSLSNLVSSPIKTASIKNIPISSSGNSSSISTGPATASTVISSCQDPISAKLTSCLCTRLGGDIPNSTLKNCVESACQSRKESSETSITESRSTMLTSTPNHKSSSSTTVATSSSLLHKTANNPILRSKHRHHHHHHHHHHHYHHHGNGSTNTNNSITNPGPRKVPVSPRSTSVLSTTNDSGFASEIDSTVASLPAAATPISQSTATANAPVDLDDSGVTLTDTRTLAEASRNLTQTLRKLSKEVFTNKIDLSSEETSRKSNSGAVIESMKNHGKGIYSGTFSGTLNPALQDRYGRPKRDISTVIHILNDLLSATPQYSRGARISFEAPSATSTTGTPATSTGLAGHSTRSKQFPSKHHHHYSHSHVDSCVKCTKTHHHSGVTNSASHICAYGECNGHYTTKPTKHSSSYTCCQDLSAPSSHHHSLQTGDANNHSDRNTCTCRFVVGDSGEREREHMCQKCLVEMENNKTKSKLDQLRLVMQQRKQKREARKLKGAPYGARVVGTTTGVTETAATVTAATTVNGNNTTGSTSLTTPLATASPSEVSPNHIVEEVDTAA